MKIKYILLFALFLTLSTAQAVPIVKQPPDTQVAFVGQEYSFTLTATETSGHGLIFSDDTDIFDIDKNTGLIKFTPREKDIGAHKINITASDGENNVTAAIKFIIAKNQPYNFDIDKAVIFARFSGEETLEKTILVSNRDSKEGIVDIEYSGSGVEISENDFNLKPTENRPVKIIFHQPQKNVATGLLTFYFGGSKKTLPVVIEKITPDKNFALSLDIPAELRDLDRTLTLATNTKVSPIKPGLRINGTITYQLFDSYNNIMAETSDSLDITNGTNIISQLKLPKVLQPGDYIVAAIVSDGSGVSTSTKTFSVSANQPELPTSIGSLSIFLPVILITVIIVAVILYFNYNKIARIEKKRAKYIEKVYTKFQSNKESIKKAQISPVHLKIQMQKLTEAYKEGYISKESYNISKRRIQRMLR